MMKKFIYTIAIAFLTITATQAQEKIEEVRTTRTTVKSSLGNETVIKKEKTTQVTPVRLDESESGQENQTLERGQTMVRKEVTYTYNDSDFVLSESDTGYTIKRTRENNTSEYGTMRKLAKGDVYMMRTEDGISVSYFDENGNMISEKYDDENDSVTIVTYTPKSDIKK